MHSPSSVLSASTPVSWPAEENNQSDDMIACSHVLCASVCKQNQKQPDPLIFSCHSTFLECTNSHDKSLCGIRAAGPDNIDSLTVTEQRKLHSSKAHII